jgi:hypothetical protein
MIIAELIGELIGRAFAEGIFYGFLKITRNTCYFLREFIFGIEKPINPKKEFDKQFLYKEIELTENLNSKLISGQKGVILEVINRNRVFAEFYDRNGNQIEWRNKIVFKIGMKQFKIKK